MLKDFFKKNINLQQESSQQINSGTINVTYEDWGFEQAKKLHGNLLGFKGCMALVKENYLKEQHGDKARLNAEVAKAEKELSKLNTEIERKEQNIKDCKAKNETLKERIENCKKDIIRIEENPQSVMKEKTSKVDFIFGLIILAFLTIYLFIFYSSASYSAFFRDLSHTTGTVNTVFYSKAIQEAYQNGGSAIFFILTIPFIFLGLGYLIHKFQEGEDKIKYLKVAVLILVTFAFDAILAYFIESKLYEAWRNNEPDPTKIPIHDMLIALSSEKFWVVIFLGFLVYVIWGFLFDFVMESYDKLDVVNQAIKAKRSEIKIYQNDIDTNIQNIEKIGDEIVGLNKKSVDYQSIINGNKVIIDWTAFEKVLLEFVNGWASWMTANKIDKKNIDSIWLARIEFIDQHKNNRMIKTNLNNQKIG